jgi:hypothetical protein
LWNFLMGHLSCLVPMETELVMKASIPLMHHLHWQEKTVWFQNCREMRLSLGSCWILISEGCYYFSRAREGHIFIPLSPY